MFSRVSGYHFKGKHGALLCKLLGFVSTPLTTGYDNAGTRVTADIWKRGNKHEWSDDIDRSVCGHIGPIFSGVALLRDLRHFL